ncbi:MAG TPA: M90 family metallopeptidase [Rubrivivax sp.]|nr:M90 family metallopeptidase [Rubrivivax sp.]HPO19245.1 M90 family metallopeptidase [Rubrivivax sp.]
MPFDPPLAALLLLLLTAAAVLLLQPWWTRRRHARLRAQAFPRRWERILRRRVPLVLRLPPPLQQRLRQAILVFVADKPFIGCGGQRIGDEQRVTIAAQACLLLLGRPDEACFPRLRQVLVYPDPFVAPQRRHLGGGVVNDAPRPLAGESWGHGQVILAWSEVLAGAADPADGHNVVLHEFAHQIDQDSGEADGRPWQRGPASRRRWDAVAQAALARLREAPSHALDAYGASDPAEFFAVATEAFFERAQALADEAPELYDALRQLYALDPRRW